MVLVDGLVYGVCVLSAIVSITRGLVREILTMISWGVSAVCMVFALEPLAVILLDYHMQSPLNWVVSGVLICAGVWILVKGINSGVRMIFKGLGISWLDNALGGVFGLVRGLLLSWLLVWGVMLVLGPDHHWVTEAKTPIWLNQFGDALQEVDWDDMSSKWLKPIAPYIEKVKGALQSSPSMTEISGYTSAKPESDSGDDAYLSV